MEHELGTGVLNWDPVERRSDRYGLVHLCSSPGSEKRVTLVQVKGSVRGRLIVIVKETRKSSHVGDLFHGVFPKTPDVGQKITLGEGTLFFRSDEEVGLRPDDGRDELWLDINALYNVHEQTVTLWFVEHPIH